MALGLSEGPRSLFSTHAGSMVTAAVEMAHSTNVAAQSRAKNPKMQEELWQVPLALVPTSGCGCSGLGGPESLSSHQPRPEQTP